MGNVGICVCWLHPPKNRHYCLSLQHVGNILFCRPSCSLSALCWRDLSPTHSLTCMWESVLASEGGNKNVELIGCSIHARQAHGFVLSFFINLLSNSYHCHDSLCCLHHRPNRTSCQYHHCCPSHLLPSLPLLLPPPSAATAFSITRSSFPLSSPPLLHYHRRCYVLSPWMCCASSMSLGMIGTHFPWSASTLLFSKT